MSQSLYDFILTYVGWDHNDGKDLLIIGEGPTQRLDDTTRAAEAKYPTNFTQSGNDLTTLFSMI